jgi:hypothetical protein
MVKVRGWPRPVPVGIFGAPSPGIRAVFHDVLSAIIDALLAIPPVRFVMGLVDSRWRPLWAALWLVLIVYLVSRTMNHLALYRARLRLLREPPDGRAFGAAPRVTQPGVPERTTTDPRPDEAFTVASEPSPPVPPAPTRISARAVPLPVVAGALLVGAVVVAGVAFAIRPAPNVIPDTVRVPAVDSASGDEPLDLRWHSGRADDDDCVGTFEVTRGAGTRARLVAFVMDTSGAVMARDSAQVASAIPGLFVEFRFRHVDCDEIHDWQMQATTPKARPALSP